MKNQIAEFKEFMKTPFPYIFTAMSLMLAWTLISNPGFSQGLAGVVSKSGIEPYELCLICSGPGVTNAISDIAFTAGNFFLFPVTAISIAFNHLLNLLNIGNPVATSIVFFLLSAIYGLSLPFVFYLALKLFRNTARWEEVSIRS
ncbi:MAG: hypothetical protein R2684_08035 [Pyrinomonadaceae bacterium]